MKFIQLLPVLSCLLLSVTPTLARDFRPATHMEYLPAGDSSVKECYVIQTTAGVGYTVQSSENLTTWTAEDSFYGLGGEYVVTMRESTPAPPLPLGSPPAVRPPPTTNVSLRMNRASGTAGGTVICWASLDDGGPRKVRIVGEMVAGWNVIPFYSERFGDFDFFIMHQLPIIAPPVENSFLGEKDTAMLASLEENLAMMNQQVTDSVARARNAPLPGPTAPGSKRFWRVFVNPEVDTDSDGSPDWSEFEIAARVAAGTADGTGVLVPGVTPDPFDSDSNGDGIPDGDQLDGDRDGTADRSDPDSSDNIAFFPLGPIPRYALFPIQTDTGTSASQPSQVLQINDKGRVLYRKATWSAGVWTPLADPSGGISANAYAINDNDVIIGNGDYRLEVDPEYFTNVIYYWNGPQAAPLPVKQNEDINQAFAGEFVYSYYMIHDPTRKTLLSNDGIFTGITRKWSADADGVFFKQDVHYSTWRLPTGSGGLSTQGQVSQDMQFHKSPSLSWNFKPDSPAYGKVFAPNSLPDLPFQPLQVYATPQGVLALPEKDEAGIPKLYTQGAWKDAAPYRHATDMSDDGIAIGRSHGNLIAPILLNGKWVSISRSAPGLTGIWTDAIVKLTNTTPHGWILAQHSPGLGAPGNSAVMLPLRAEGKFTNSSGVVVETAAGVDDVSIGSPNPGDTVKDRIWIMAPKGGPAKQVTLKSPLNADTPLKLSGTGVSFSGTDGSVTLTQAETVINLTAESAASGTDVPLDLKFGGLQSLSKPLGVKVMKRRVVKATIHLVASLVDGKAPNLPNVIPNQLEMKKYLDDIYGPQVNATFDLQVKPMVNLKWDIATSEDFGVSDPNDLDIVKLGNGMLDFKGGEVLGREEAIVDNTLRDNSVDINIYILGGAAMYGLSERNGKLQKATALGAYGYAKRDKNVVFLDGDVDVWDRFFERDSAAENKHTIAHEIGHLIMKYGHPDEGGGAAPLPGLPASAYPDRLMTGGGKTKRPEHGKLLVKGEWDAAEEWMVNYPDRRGNTQ
jgi:hypothetical protein